MFKSEFLALGLLTLSLCGCPEQAGESKSTRTGSVGVTSQDIDDLAKPVSKPQGGGGSPTP